MAAGGRHGESEAHDGRSESDALRAIWRPARPFRHDVGHDAALAIADKGLCKENSGLAFRRARDQRVEIELAVFDKSKLAAGNGANHRIIAISAEGRFLDEFAMGELLLGDEDDEVHYRGRDLFGYELDDTVDARYRNQCGRLDRR
jgi:hypothetical protein